MEALYHASIGQSVTTSRSEGCSKLPRPARGQSHAPAGSPALEDSGHDSSACYGPSSARDLKVLAANRLPFAARTAFSSTFKPRPGPSGSAMYPSTGRSTFGHRRWPSSSNGRKYSVMMKFGIHAEAWTVADSAMVVEL